MASILERGTLTIVQETPDECNRELGTLQIPFPADIDLAQIVNVQVLCIDTIRRKMWFGVHDPSGSPIHYGSAQSCAGGTNDLMFNTLVAPRFDSTDFRYFMDGGNIIVQKLGLSPELERCIIRASITYFG